MTTERDFRLPYGPGWEDPDWQPHVSPADDRVRTLTGYMTLVRRHAPRQAANAPRLPARKVAPKPAFLLDPARRRMVASGACMLAVGSLLLPGATRRLPETVAETVPAAAPATGSAADES